MYVTLQETKQHLNIDEDYNDDDKYILSLINVSENVIEKHINQSLTGFTTSLILSGETVTILENPLRQAVLLFVGNLYANREINAYTNVTKLPFNYEYLLDFYIKYD